MIPGKVFVSDPKARFSTASFVVYTKGVSHVQLDFAALNSTENCLAVSAGAESNVTLFASESIAPVVMEVQVEVGPLTRNPLCVATKDDVELIYRASYYRKNNTKSVIAGGSTCVKLPLPPREPALIGDDSATASDIGQEASAPTFPPSSAAGGSSKKTTPVPAAPGAPPAPTLSSAAALVSTGALAALMSMGFAWC